MSGIPAGRDACSVAASARHYHRHRPDEILLYQIIVVTNEGDSGGTDQEKQNDLDQEKSEGRNVKGPGSDKTPGCSNCPLLCWKAAKPEWSVAVEHNQVHLSTPWSTPLFGSDT